jgi:hypothetical protein
MFVNQKDLSLADHGISLVNTTSSTNTTQTGKRVAASSKQLVLYPLRAKKANPKLRMD